MTANYTAVWFTLGIILIIVGVAVYVAIFFKSKKFEYRLAELLEKPDLNINKDILDQIRTAILAERDAERNAPSIVRTIADKISNDIRWDIAGLIGITVTFMLVIMIIAAQADRIPKEMFVGWSVILGFYFGRTTTKIPKPSTEKEVVQPK